MAESDQGESPEALVGDREGGGIGGAARIRLAVLIALSVFVYAVMMSSRMTISLMTLHLTHSAAIAGVMGSVYSLMPVVVGLTAGRMIDRFGTLWPVVVSIAVTFLGLLAPVVLPSVWTLGMAAMAQGAGFIVAAMALTNATVLMSSVQDRTRNVSWVYLGNSAGMALGPLAAGFGIDHVGHRGTFALLAVLPLVSISLMLWMRHQFPGRAGTGRPVGGSAIALLRDANLRALLVVQALIGVTLESFYFLVPLHGTQIGLSASVIGTVVSCAFISNFASRASLPMLVRRFGEVNVIAATFVVVAVSVAPLGNVSAPGALMALAAGCGISHGMIFPVLTSLFYDVSPLGRQGEVGGVRTMVANSTTSGTQLVAGALSASVGIAPVMWVAGAVAMGGAWFVRRHVHATVRASLQ